MIFIDVQMLVIIPLIFCFILDSVLYPQNFREGFMMLKSNMVSMQKHKHVLRQQISKDF